MKKVSLIIHQNYLENVIEKLHEIGMMEIIEISKDNQNFEELNKHQCILILVSAQITS